MGVPPPPGLCQGGCHLILWSPPTVALDMGICMDRWCGMVDEVQTKVWGGGGVGVLPLIDFQNIGDDIYYVIKIYAYKLLINKISDFLNFKRENNNKTKTTKNKIMQISCTVKKNQ